MKQTPTPEQDAAIERADEYLRAVGLPIYGDVSGTLARIISLIERPSDELGHHLAVNKAIADAKALYATAPAAQIHPEATTTIGS